MEMKRAKSAVLRLSRSVQPVSALFRKKTDLKKSSLQMKNKKNEEKKVGTNLV